MPAKIKTTVRNGELIATTQEIVQERLQEFADGERGVRELEVTVDLADPAQPMVRIETSIGEQELVVEASADNVVQAVDDAARQLHQRLQERRAQKQEEQPKDRDERTNRIVGGVAVVLLVGIAGFTIRQLSLGGSGIATYPVTGKVTLPDGSPVTSGRIMFNNAGQPQPSATGDIRSDGSYQLKTFTENDGAAAGTFAVAIAGMEPDTRTLDPEKGVIGKEPKPLIDKKYFRSSTSGLTAEVSEGTMFDFTVDPPQ